MVYNFTALMAANTTLQQLDAIDIGIFGGAFFTLMIVVAALIMMMALSGYKAKEMMLFTSFFVSVMAGFFWISGLVPFFTAIVSILLTVVFTLVYFFTDK